MKKKRIFYLMLIVIILISGCSSDNSNYSQTNSSNNIGSVDAQKENKEDNIKDKKDVLMVHFIDVGQADAILIQIGDHAMIIDAGNNNDGELVSSYIKEQNIDSLEYVIGTHPHEDHIGGLDVVINNYKIKNVLLPSYVMATDTYEDLLLAIQNNNLVITKPVVGTEYSLGDAKFVIIAPNREDYGDNPNNYSIGIKLTYGNNSFVMVGDAEAKSEEDMIAGGIDLEADVLKINHHGANTSNTEEFLKAVNPIYAVISVGKDNDYGHPSSNVVTSLMDDDVQIYRTDEMGTIIISSNGKNLSFQTETAASNIEEDNKTINKTETDNKTISNTEEDIKTISTIDDTIYITESGEKYHLDGCRYLNESKILISLEEAKHQGYSPCGVCKPPQ